MADSSETRVNKLLPTTAELEKSILALQALARHIAAGVRADMDTYAKLNALGGSDVDSATGLDEIRLANE